MQCFIGGACSGRRALVAARYPEARWHRLTAGDGAAGWRDAVTPGVPLVVDGWADWLCEALAGRASDEAIRVAGQALLDALAAAQDAGGHEVVLILDEMGRGIVPMEAADRRLRDLNGWLVQDAAARAEAVWYLRHGLARRLKPGGEAR